MCSIIADASSPAAQVLMVVRLTGDSCQAYKQQKQQQLTAWFLTCCTVAQLASAAAPAPNSTACIAAVYATLANSCCCSSDSSSVGTMPASSHKPWERYNAGACDAHVKTSVALLSSCSVSAAGSSRMERHATDAATHALEPSLQQEKQECG
jgi:hypothetical protein